MNENEKLEDIEIVVTDEPQKTDNNGGVSNDTPDIVVANAEDDGADDTDPQSAIEKLQKKSGEGYKFSSGTYSDESKHGRNETRYYQIINNVQEKIDPSGEWKNLKSIIKVDYLRKESNGKMSFEQFYYISSLSNDAKKFAEDIRQHWKIENQLHWVLDVQFREDDLRIRKDYSPENLAIIRQIALNLLNKEFCF